MKNYETYARKYPAIISMLIPAIVTTQILSSWFSQLQECWGTALSVIEVFVPIGVVYGAIGYFADCLQIAVGEHYGTWDVVLWSGHDV